MEFKVRTICTTCNGSGTNDLTEAQALAEVNRWQTGGVTLTGFPPSLESQIRRRQMCMDCVGGYKEDWIDEEQFTHYIQQMKK